jgi:thioredoxin-like negative regulator of GroEL
MTKAVGNLEEAERLIKRAIQLRPMNTRFRVELAGILRLQGREEEAQAEMEKSRAFQADRTQQFRLDRALGSQIPDPDTSVNSAASCNLRSMERFLL